MEQIADEMICYSFKNGLQLHILQRRPYGSLCILILFAFDALTYSIGQG